MKIYSLVIYIFSLSLFVVACVQTSFDDFSTDIERDCPVVRSVSPPQAGFGTTITIEGENFLEEDATLYQVFFDGTPLSGLSLERVDNTTLQFILPKGVASGLLTVDYKNDPCGNASQGAQFNYLFTPNATQFAGQAGNGSCPNCFQEPTGIDVVTDADGDFLMLIVSDAARQVIREVDINGSVSSPIAGADDVAACISDEFSGLASRFNEPSDLVVDPISNEIVLLDKGTRTVRKIKSGVNRPVLELAASCNAFGCTEGEVFDESQAMFIVLGGVAVDSAGRIFITDSGCKQITLAQLENVANPDNYRVSNFLSNSPLLIDPSGIDYFHSSGGGQLFISDIGNGNILSVDVSSKQIDIVVNGSGSILNKPVDLEVSRDGTIFVIDQASRQLIQINTDGTVLPLFSDLIEPQGIALHEKDNTLYITDKGANTIVKVVLE